MASQFDHKYRIAGISTSTVHATLKSKYNVWCALVMIAALSRGGSIIYCNCNYAARSERTLYLCHSQRMRLVQYITGDFLR